MDTVIWIVLQCVGYAVALVFIRPTDGWGTRRVLLSLLLLAGMGVGLWATIMELTDRVHLLAWITPAVAVVLSVLIWIVQRHRANSRSR